MKTACLVRAPATALVLALACCLAGGGASPPPCDYPAAVAYAGPVDSLGLQAFLALPAPEQARRRDLAREWKARGEQIGTVSERLQAWRTAAGLAPDDGAALIELAATYRYIGDRAAAEACLLAARATVPLALPQDRPLRRKRIALDLAWLCRDRGDWSLGLQWVDSALAEPGNNRGGLLLKGLLRGQSGDKGGAMNIASRIEDSTPPLEPRWAGRWIRALAELGEGNAASAMTGMAWTTRSTLEIPGFDHRADSGFIDELLGRYDQATWDYDRAARLLPFRESDCLRRLDLPLREDGRGPKLPVWLAFDRWQAAGSGWAYALEATRRFEAADRPGARDFWGDAAINALSACLRKNLHPHEARGLRGRVYAQLEVWGAAEADLRRALAEDRKQLHADAAVLYWLGFLKVKGERYEEALPLLRETVAADSTHARGWNSLGFALVMTGNLPAAGAALDRALALDAGLTAAWYNRGLMNFNAGHGTEAVRDLRKAAALAPDNAAIQRLLGRAQQLAARPTRP